MMNAHDQLAFCCLNLARSSFQSGMLKLVLDAYCLLHKESISLARVTEIVEYWGCSHALWAILVELKGWPGVDISDEYLERTMPASIKRQLIGQMTGQHKRRVGTHSQLMRVLLFEWPLSNRSFWPVEYFKQRIELRIRDFIA